ncbi:hypothetical protein B5807_05057 [Epicoccum nigrum]|uniref:Uncharacterized protein n=1 Tax=Epicoccum nigrum TaxID=105696 RepID=A0A1Y2M289_EPING|nr:hypothetical protein B5807_05057 [Epicoccum nigrum]
MSLGRSIKSNKSTMAGAVASGLAKAASEPLLTGALLYLLTRGSPRLRARLLSPFQTTLPVFTNTPAGVARLAKLITLLKLLTAAGVLRRANRALNRLAWNNWSLGRNGAAWQFGPSRREVVLITGGSSGFGYEMVKAFAPHARVVVIDVVAFPPELEALDGVHFYQGDLADTAALEVLCERIRREQGTVSVLINNAGIGVGKTLLEVSLFLSVGFASLSLSPSVVASTFCYCFHLSILLSPFGIAFTFASTFTFATTSTSEYQQRGIPKAAAGKPHLAHGSNPRLRPRHASPAQRPRGHHRLDGVLRRRPGAGRLLRLQDRRPVCDRGPARRGARPLRPRRPLAVHDFHPPELAPDGHLEERRQGPAREARHRAGPAAARQRGGAAAGAEGEERPRLRAQGPGEACGCAGLAEVGAGSGVRAGVEQESRTARGFIRGWWIRVG